MRAIRKMILTTVLLMMTLAPVHAAIVINEIISGGYPDWIELHNSGSASVDISNYFLSDNTSNLRKWAFPQGTRLGAGRYLVVYASGIDIADQVPGQLNASFKINKSGNPIYLSDTNLNIVDRVDPVDMRMWGNVGVSLARLPNATGAFQASHTPTFGAVNTAIAPVSDDIIFNEIMGNNHITLRSSIIDPVDNRNGFYEWIELYNKSNSAKSLDGYRIDYVEDEWPFPAGITIPARGYVTIFASGKNRVITTTSGREIHTSFTLRNIGGAAISLKRPSGSVIDFAYIGDMNTDISIGRVPDGTANLQDLVVPSPNTNNQTTAIDVHEIVVNEVATKEELDWIELYNTSTSAINVGGSYLSDDEGNLRKWQFPPQIVIPAKQYLLVYASSQNQVVLDAEGRVMEIHTNFSIKDDGTEAVIFSSSNGTYVNKVNRGLLAMIRGQSYARIPDGSVVFQRVASQTPGASNVNLNIPPDPYARDIVINEILPDNDSNINLDRVAYPGGDKQDWIELYNKGTHAVNVGGMMLQDNSTIWLLPERIINPGSYLLVFASGNNLRSPELHTNFLFNHSKAFTLSLLNTDRAVLQTIDVPALGHDVSYARISNGTGNFIMATQPSPAAVNINTPLVADPVAAASVVINEVVSKNVNDIGLTDIADHPLVSKQDWIELYNKGNSRVNLYELKLSDTNTAWTFDRGAFIDPGQHLIVYATGAEFNNADTGIQSANFAISAEGETIQLLNKDNSVISSIAVPALAADEAYARVPSATGDFRIIAGPTPGVTNVQTAANPQASNLTINEVMSNNVNNLNLNLTAYPEGTQQDWIEIYNKGSVPVELGGLKLADSASSWVFPTRTINPGQYVLVFASGRDLRGSQLHTNFSISATQGETIRLLNRDNSIVESVDVPPLATDESLSRLPNGSGSFTVVTQPSPTAANRDAAVVPNPQAVNITINEVLTNNTNNIGLNLTTYPGGNHEDWIELYNKSTTVSVNLEGLKLADANNDTWVLPARTLLPGQTLLIFASGNNLTANELHTNFNLSSTLGETLRFLNKDNSVIETVAIPILPADQSFARSPNGTGNFAIVNQPTPAAINNNVVIPPNPNAANITINEVVTQNVNNIGINLIVNPLGDHQDWIELYNKGSVDVNLQGLKLTDKSNALWVFPSRTLRPGEYLLVFASGNNLYDQQLHANFSLSASAGDTLRFLNTDNSEIQVVNIPPLADDQSYARFVNGTGDFRIMSQPTPSIANTNTPVVARPEAVNITINEVLTNNNNNINLNISAYPGGNHEDWIELYNKGTVTVNLQGLKLADKSNNTWIFPARNLAAGEYLLVFASGKDIAGPEYHTNFKLSSTEGDQLRLLNTDNSVISSVDLPVLSPDTSYVRLPNGRGTGFTVTTVPNPGALNPSVKLHLDFVMNGMTGFVNVTPSAPNCAPTAAYPICKEFPQGTQVTLSPNTFLSTTRFAGWSDSRCPGQNSCTFRLDNTEVSLTAYFSDVAQWGNVTPQFTSTKATINLAQDNRVSQVKVVVKNKSTDKTIFDSGPISSRSVVVDNLPSRGDELKISVCSKSSDTQAWLNPCMEYSPRALYQAVASRLPDLAIAQFFAEGLNNINANNFYARAGQKVFLTATIVNQGNISADKHQFQFYVDGKLLNKQPVTIGSITNGSRNMQTFTCPVSWVATGGIHQIKVMVDSRNQVEETNESNNIGIKTITVRNATYIIEKPIVK